MWGGGSLLPCCFFLPGPSKLVLPRRIRGDWGLPRSGEESSLPCLPYSSFCVLSTEPQFQWENLAHQ